MVRVAVAVALVLGLLAAAGPVAAAMVPGQAEVMRVTGQVEVMVKGQTQWTPVTVGMKLGAGDDIRAHKASAAELALPDGTTILLAENSRFVVNQLDYDAQDRTRVALFHLVAGKMRAIVSKAATTLVRTRQSNFAISTPAAVAAARGTDFEVTYDAGQKTMRVAVLKEDADADDAKPDKKL
jgi:hypothetical protein